MLQTLKDYLPLEIWFLVIAATIFIMYKSRRSDSNINQQEDEDNDNVISGDFIDMKYCDGGVEDDEILRNVHKN